MGAIRGFRDGSDEVEGERVEEVEGGGREGLEGGGVAREDGGGTDEVVGGGDMVLLTTVKWCCPLVVATMVPENLWETTLTLPRLTCEWPR